MAIVAVHELVAPASSPLPAELEAPLLEGALPDPDVPCGPLEEPVDCPLPDVPPPFSLPEALLVPLLEPWLLELPLDALGPPSSSELENGAEDLEEEHAPVRRTHAPSAPEPINNETRHRFIALLHCPPAWRWPAGDLLPSGTRQRTLEQGKTVQLSANLLLEPSPSPKATRW
jgi:hypothetical protein